MLLPPTMCAMTITSSRQNSRAISVRRFRLGIAAAAIGLVLPLLAAPPANASSPTPPDRDAPWLTVAQANADVDALDAQVRANDPNPFLDHSEREWKAGLANLRRVLPRLSQVDAQLALTRQVALLDTHAGIFPEELGFHSYGFWSKEFSDGQYVLNAIDKSLVGARLVSVNGVPIDIVNRLLVPYLNADNRMGVLTLRPWFLIKTEYLVQLHIVRDAAQPRFGFRMPNGRTRIVNMPPLTTDGWNVMWETPVPATFPELYSHQYDGNYAEVVGHDVIYSFNSVENDNTEAIATMTAAIASGAADRVIFDMRYCGGGNFPGALPAIEALESPAINKPNRLIVITGRDNNSAASVVASELEHGTNAIFAGETPPTKPNPMLDEITFVLPNSQVTVHVPTYQWVFDASDRRPAITIDHPVEPAARAFFAARDNVLEAAVAIAR